MSIADANRFRELEARVTAQGAGGSGGLEALAGLERRVATLERDVPGAGEMPGGLIEVVAALQRRIASLENTVKLQQGMLNAIRDKRG